MAAESSNPTPEARGGGQEEQPHVQGAVAARCRRAERNYSTFKVRRGDSSKIRNSREEIPHVQGKRNPNKRVGVARGCQRADTLKP